jgi:hypothetical protein
MPDFKKLADKAREFLGQHQDQADEGIKKAGDFADKRTGGRHSDQIHEAEQRAEGFMGGGGQPGQGQDQGGQSAQDQGGQSAQDQGGQPGQG